MSASGDFPVSIVNESLVIGAAEFLGLEGEGGLDLVSIDVITNLGPGLIGVSLSVILLVDFLGEATFNVLNGGQTLLKEWADKDTFDLPNFSWGRP